MGALTLKTFSDELREWEFIEAEGIDPTDSFGTDLRLSIRENQIFLAEPNDLTTPWITDRGRLFFDGMFNSTKNSYDIQWNIFFNELIELIYFNDHLCLKKISNLSLFFVVENISLEALNILYLLQQHSSIIQIRKAEKYSLTNDLESDFQINRNLNKSKLAKSNLGLLINTDIRYEGYVLNLNLRQRFLKGNFKLLAINSLLNTTFPVYHLGSNIRVLRFIGEGTHLVCQDLKNSLCPLLITNTETHRRSDATQIRKILKYTSIVDSVWSGFNVLNHSLSSTGIISLSTFLPFSSEDYKNFFSLYFINTFLQNNSNINRLVELQLLQLLKQPVKSIDSLYINQNNNTITDSVLEKMRNMSKNNDNYFYLPNNLFFEDSETYVNTQGRIKRVNKFINFQKGSKTNWQIIRKFYSKLKKLTIMDNQKDKRLLSFNCINSFNYKNYINFHFYSCQSLTSLSFYLGKYSKPLNPITINSIIKSSSVKIVNSKLQNWLDDFYNGSGKDFYSYNSSILINCSKMTRVNNTNFF